MRVLIAEVGDLPFAHEWMAGMSLEKRERILRMRHKKDAWAAITAHRLLCFALKTYAGYTPSCDDWGKGEYGKPYLKRADDIHFNLSHSGDMALCALGDSAVGADIERIKPCSDAVAKRVMSEEERELYLSSTDKETLFFQIWTLKEAYLKYTGKGLSALDSITVFPSQGGIKSNVRECRFTLIGGIPGYQAAVCSDTEVSSVERIGLSGLMSL